MKILYFGTEGPQVQLLQLALERAGYSPGELDGIFGRRTLLALRRFQAQAGLVPDGVAGRATHDALHPWYAGYRRVVLRPGDSFYRLARRYGSSVAAVAAANPGLDPLRLPVGAEVVVPLSFDVVPTNVDYCSALVDLCCEGIAARYPFVARSPIGESVMGTRIESLTLGDGAHRVLYNAAHHANEWITAPLLLRFTEALAAAYVFDASVAGRSARTLLRDAALAVVPCVNPDGMDLVTGDLRSGVFYEAARRIAADYPAIPFPSGWKANVLGTDPNLQYPAGWAQAREIKFAQGYVSPAPRDYVGEGPLTAPESLALYDFTLAFSPALTLSYHTQGRVIYWKYLDQAPPGAAALAARFSALSGYTAETTPYASGFAGYKDWFIQDFARPGFTIEAGAGENPLPIEDLPQIYAENLGILTAALEPFPVRN